MTSSDWIGRTIGGRYQIQDLLGQGGMSAVYKAYDPNLRRVVAVKIIHPHLSQDTQFIHRFEEEAASVAQLRHPNLIQVYDFNHDQGVYFIIFEFVPGETVQARLKRMKAAGLSMDVEDAVNIARQSADGLHNAHKKGLIHRDIKPANIMINVNGNPIIMDFGIAKIMGGTQHTATGAVLGTARYMSPEQIQGDHIDPRTDIYSLGVTLFEMLGGRPPFEANSAMTLMMMHISDPVPDLKAIRNEVSPELIAIVNKALAKKADDRFQSAAAMSAALANIKSYEPVAGATMLEGSPIDPDKTVVETPPPAAATSREVVAAAEAVPAAGMAASGTTPSPPVSVPPSAAKGGSRSFLYIAGALVVLLLIAFGLWAAFLRDGGDEQIAVLPTEVPAAVVEASDTPDAAATEDALATQTAADQQTRAAESAAQTAEAAPTDTPEATDEPTAEPTEENEPATTEPTAESIATIDQVEGEVMMVSPDGQEIPLGPDTPISEGTQFITGQDGRLALTLQDDSVVQLLENSDLRLDALAADDANEFAQTAYTMLAGDLLLQVPPGGSEQAIFSEAGVLLASVANGSPAADRSKNGILSKQAQQNAQNAAMSLKIDDQWVTITCFSGDCTTAGGNDLNAGWERVITQEGGFISLYQVNNRLASYEQWQTICNGCLPTAPPPPTSTPTSTPIPPTPTPSPTTAGTVTGTATTVGTPTATAASTATATAEGTVTATMEAGEGTPEASPTPEQPSYSARITGITLQDGRYIVDFVTSGYTPQLPGRHVHFFFDTVSTANAGVPGSGPWKLYGGPSPFTEYSEADKYFEPTAMCILVANEDHSIIPGTGNCYPLP